MARDRHGKARGRVWKRVGGGLGVVVVAMLGAIGTGLGERLVDWLDGEDKRSLSRNQAPISHSAQEVVLECGTRLFVPAPRARAIASGQAPAAADWNAFRRENDAAIVSPNAVEVSIQGESARTVTLTRIEFGVERRPRPAGLTFARPCGGPIVGRFVAVDLDRDPLQVTETADDARAEYLAPGVQGDYRPIRFPWTVSVTDPLLLYVIANTRRCLCRWRAGIHWRSGAQSGVLRVDNGGRGYRVASGPGSADYLRDARAPSGWRRLTH